ncbi:hypothetical protein [Halovulum sp. GXIMD14793]
MDMHFSFDLDLEVTDETGKTIRRQKLYNYVAPSALLYPANETQFWNDITAGISLQDPGRYELRFIFTDNIRDGGPKDAVTFPVVIE